MAQVQEFYDASTGTLSYLVFDAKSRDAVLIDPLLSYDLNRSSVSYASLEPILALIDKQNLKLGMVLETHPHADHLSAADRLRTLFPGLPLGIGAGITRVQSYFKEMLGLDPHLPTDGRQFDRLFADGERFSVGSLSFEVIATPGHTPACVSYRLGDHVFVGDALFMPDYGTGRCDFPGASAAQLFRSVTEKLYTLPEHVLIYTGHDYCPQGRALRFQATVGEEKRENIHIKSTTREADFVRFRSERDATLDMPRLFYPSLQVNIDAGRLPPFLKWPLHSA